jgi:hypothetical protein
MDEIGHTSRAIGWDNPNFLSKKYMSFSMTLVPQL